MSMNFSYPESVYVMLYYVMLFIINILCNDIHIDKNLNF